MSASCSPSWPRDTAPIGYTRARFASAAFLRMYSVTPALSFTGFVFGMHATAVNPPATAAAVPVAIVSLCSCPGSRRCTCMSISPGHTTNPLGISTTAVSASTGEIAADPQNPVVVDQHVEHAVTAVRRIDDPPALE